MKNYKKLTKWSKSGTLHVIDFNGKEIPLDDVSVFDIYNIAHKLSLFENKIESGELIDLNELTTAETTSDLTEKEIEFFIKHNEKVRKETAREVLKPLREVVMKHPDCCVNLSEDIEFLWRKYGLELEDKE